MLRPIFNLYAWLTLADYQEANAAGTKSIIIKFTRGNILLKNGLFVTQRVMDLLSIAGDRALARLQKKIASH